MSKAVLEDLPDRTCRELAEGHYENFSVVTRLMPEAQRPHIMRVYAYCRYVDDLADEGPYSPSERLERLETWGADLRACWNGRPEHPILQALQRSIQQLLLPIEPFERLLEANRMDQRRNRYATFDDVREYCRHSADPVGEMVLRVFGLTDPEFIALSDRICTGLQLANFCQDVAVDRTKDRIYLPLESMGRFGVTEADLDSGTATDAFKRLMAFEVTRAREYLIAGAPLAQHVPGPLRAPLGLFVRGGLAILERIEACDYDVLRERPTVSKGAKLMIAVRTLVSQRFGRW